MKHLLLTLTLFIGLCGHSQLDTLAIQDFELTPQTPTWTYTGTPYGFQQGYAPASGTSIPNAEWGIGGSRSWHVEQVSGGNPLTFDNVTIPGGYDTIRASFRLSGQNMTSTTGGPDYLDYVLVEYSLDGGATFVQRVRVRGADNNNCFWSFNALGSAQVQHLPAMEELFNPVNSGLQETEGISYVEIAFPGSITELSLRITPRSSTTSDDWLVDNVVLTGENQCITTTSAVTETVCETYTAPSGAIYTSSGVFNDTIANTAGCDSIITIDLTVHTPTSGTDSLVACDSLTWIDGITYTASNDSATFTLTNSAGCDSLVTLNLVINSTPSNSVTQTGTTLTADISGLTYQWVDCDNNNSPINGETGQSYTPINTGNYAVEITSATCTATSDCFLVDYTSIDELLPEEKELVKIVDLLGRETKFVPNVPLIYIYSDGSTERKIKSE
ncbi:MAG: hypothetical protein NXI10_07775 [bacterium]|nr:hypothetical protein [bacterium]